MTREILSEDRDRVDILLVDDQPGKLLTYEAMLSDLGENLIKTESARRALEMLLRSDVAVILIDVCMPELDGIELATIIRNHPRYKRIPIIFVSALQVSDLDRLRGYEAGAVDYVPVPVVPEVLRAKIAVFVDLHRKTRELQRMNAQLEERVAERTMALEESSRRLERLNAELEDRVEERTREREEALAKLFEAQKLETIGKLTGGIAHDFNNLLMAVTGSLELLKRRLPTSDARIQRLVDTAIQGADRGSSLTQRLLAFSRRQELRPESIDIASLIRNMASLLERAVGPGIRIETLLPDNLCSAHVDGHQLELAILNLAVNARDAMPNGGLLTIRAAKLSPEGCGALAKGDYITISVADSGIGMDQKTLARASEPFFTTKGIGKGTGLGLSMVKGLVEQSGGRLQIESSVGDGTVVDIVLPAADAGTCVEVVETDAHEALIGGVRALCTVLLVDDDPLVLAGTCDMLEELGHSVLAVASAEEALSRLADGGEPDLVLTDHAMPGMTGLALANRITETCPQLPVVIASGYAELSELAESGRYPRIAKPFKLKELAAVIERAVPPLQRALHASTPAPDLATTGQV